MNKYLLIILVLAPLFYNYPQGSLYLVGTVYGEKPGDLFYHVRNVGDVNGDGYDDFIVGSEKNYLKLYFGGPDFDSSRYVRFQANGLNKLGFFACGLGDINGDGYDDFLIQAVEYDGFSGVKQANIYYGKKNIDTIPDVVLSGEYIQDTFGTSAAAVGDVNGDGYDDFLVGAYYNWTTGKGRVRLYLGNKTLEPNNYIQFQDNAAGDPYFGKSLSGLGDINKDGFDDFAICDPTINTVYIYYGGKVIDTTADLSYNIANLVAYEKAVISAGDINGDEKPDWIITGDNHVYIFTDTNTFTNIINLDSGNISNYLFGMCGGGDINGDGYDDFVLSNPGYRNKDSLMVGGLWIFYGGKQIDTIPKIFLSGKTYQENFGFGSSFIGDYNNDGLDELAVPSNYYPDSKTQTEKVSIYSSRKITGVSDGSQVFVNDFKLLQNYPNPFNPKTMIRFSIPIKSGIANNIQIKVFDVLGREITTLKNEQKNAGDYEIEFDGSGLPSGVYFYRLQAGSFTEMKKMILIK